VFGDALHSDETIDCNLFSWIQSCLLALEQSNEQDLTIKFQSMGVTTITQFSGAFSHASVLAS